MKEGPRDVDSDTLLPPRRTAGRPGDDVLGLSALAPMPLGRRMAPLTLGVVAINAPGSRTLATAGGVPTSAADASLGFAE